MVPRMSLNSSDAEPVPAGAAKPTGPVRPPRIQYSVRTLLIFFALIGVVCWFIRRATAPPHDTLITASWAHPEQRRQFMAHVQALSDDELEAVVTAAVGNPTVAGQPDSEACLVEVIARSSPHDARWSKLLEKLNAQQSANDPSFKRFQFPSADLALLTALCRVNREPDPLAIEVKHTGEIVCLLPNRPSLNVQLANRDVQKRAFELWFGGDYGSGRQTKFSIEISDDERRALPAADPGPRAGGGGPMYPQNFQWGDVEPFGELPLASYVAIDRPGSYTVRVLYHPNVGIADEGHTVGRIMYCSEPVRLTLKIPPFKLNNAVRYDARDWIAALPATGPVVVVHGPFGPWLSKQIPLESAAGHLLAMGFQAMPELLAELRRPDITLQQRGWMLALLSSITGFNDPIPSGDWGFVPDSVLLGTACVVGSAGSVPDLGPRTD